MPWTKISPMHCDWISMTRPASCRGLLRPIAERKTSLSSDFSGTLEAQGHLPHLTINEAEALAWRTSLPNLVVPVLAKEEAGS